MTAMKGIRLEYLVAAVFQGQGYLVRRSMPLKYGESGQDATDIDVLGIRFTQPFQPHIIICDCKDKQRSKPYERIFWARGLATFVKASETYVALPRASLDIINFAREGQVRVLPNEVWQDSYLKLYGTDHQPFGVSNNKFFEAFDKRLETLIRQERKAAEILVEAKSLFLTREPYVALNIALSHLQTCAAYLKRTAPGTDDRLVLWKYLASELTVLLTILILYIASDTLGLSKSERERHILDKLTYGDLSKKKANAIFSSAKEYAVETIKSLAPEVSTTSLQAFALGNIEPPHYARNVIGLVERAINSPALYHELPQLIDFLLFEQSLQGRGFSDEQYQRLFPGPMQDEKLKVARNIFAFLRDDVGFELNVFWPKQEGNMPRKD